MGRTARALFSGASLLALMIAATPARADDLPPAPVQVVFVHGYQCQDVSTSTAGEIGEEYYAGVPSEQLHPIAYYGCDAGGESIVGAGPANSPNCASSRARLRLSCPVWLRSRDSDGTDTDLRRFAYELAWYLYDQFGPAPIDLVGHSLGGLLITYALQQITAGNPAYPPSLTVPLVMTFSTPFGGSTYCDNTLECLQMQPTGTRSLVKGIRRVGAVQLPGAATQWTVVGSDGCDAYPSSNTTALRQRTHAVIYTSPCYAHMDYMWDYDQPSDAVGTEDGVAFSAGWHSLDLMRTAITDPAAV